MECMGEGTIKSKKNRSKNVATSKRKPEGYFTNIQKDIKLREKNRMRNREKNKFLCQMQPAVNVSLTSRRPPGLVSNPPCTMPNKFCLSGCALAAMQRSNLGIRKHDDTKKKPVDTGNQIPCRNLRDLTRTSMYTTFHAKKCSVHY